MVKGNCLLALTGLAVAVAKHEKGLTLDTEETIDVSSEFSINLSQC